MICVLIVAASFAGGMATTWGILHIMNTWH